VRIYCYPHRQETLKADASTYKKNLEASILKTGIIVNWSVALISQDGEVLFPE